MMLIKEKYNIFNKKSENIEVSSLFFGLLFFLKKCFFRQRYTKNSKNKPIFCLHTILLPRVAKLTLQPVTTMSLISWVSPLPKPLRL